MKKFGLSEEDYQIICRLFREHPSVEEVIVFGSRALGTAQEASDIDLAIKGPVNQETLALLKSRLEEELSLPYFFDLVAYPSIGNPDLKKHIDEYGRVFYSRKMT